MTAIALHEPTLLSTARPRVLLVEDDAGQAELLSRWLERGGMDVSVATDRAAGAAMAQSGGWDCVLSDIWLPDGDGLEVASTSKTQHPNTPVVLMTASGDLALAMRAMSDADALLLKPLDRHALISRLRDLVAHGRTRSKMTAATETVLAIGAHPDDVEIGCGGILAAHRALGRRVVIATLTGGEQGGAGAVRRDEAAAAAHLLGADLVVGNLPDTCLTVGPETIGFIESVIREVQPSIIYTHTAHDMHQDHRATHHATLVAARRVANVYCYQSPSSSVAFAPTRFVDITASFEQKRALLKVHASQSSTRAYLGDEIVLATARYWARFAGYGLVEPLEVIRESTSLRAA
jgi:LmbE family N-acetylglucosaminyl deacetylase/CheY-like chemotaxis protein